MKTPIRPPAESLVAAALVPRGLLPLVLSTLLLAPLASLLGFSNAWSDTGDVAGDVQGVEAIHLRQILVATDKEAKDLIAQIMAGADFKSLAREKSLAPSGKAAGGDYGFVQRGILPPEIEQVAFSMKPGELRTVPSPKGIHILQLLGRRHETSATPTNVPLTEPARVRVAEPDQAVQLEKDGLAAEDAGKFKEAFAKLGEVITVCGIDVSADAYMRTREEVLKVAGHLDAKPEVPEEARRHMVRGKAFVENAQDPAGFKRAITEMEQALLVAPWWATGYFNLGLTQESAKDYDGAIRSFKLYLIAAPESADARSVKDKIYKLEAAKEIETSH